MQSTQTYDDGFPQNPTDAIDFSYFLSDDEKADWKVWLESASPEQQFELVDTLHAMWQENQKSAIPNGFNQPQSQTDNDFSQASTQQQTSTPSDASQAGNASTTNNQDGQQGFQSQSNQHFDQTQPYQPDTSMNKNSDEYSLSEDIAPQPNPSPAPAPTPAPNPAPEPAPSPKPAPKSSNPTTNQSIDSRPKEDAQQSKQTPKKESKPKANNSTQQINTTDDSKATSDTSSNKPKTSSQAFFNVTKLRESATKQELEDLYGEYVDLRESNFANTHAFYEAQGKFLDKIMAVVINFEKVADFFDSLSEKLIDINDKLVAQVKDYNSIKGTITAKHGDLMDQVELLRNDVDRLYRSTREDRSDNRRKFEDVQTQLATIGADSYGSGDGMLQRLDLLSSKIHKLELELNRTKQVYSPSNTVVSNPPKSPVAPINPGQNPKSFSETKK